MDWSEVEADGSSSSGNDWSLVQAADGLDATGQAAAAQATPIAINWDMEVAATTADTAATPPAVDISWDVEPIDASASGVEASDMTAAGTAAGEISWDIEVEDTAAASAEGAEPVAIDWGVSVSGAGDEGAVAQTVQPDEEASSCTERLPDAVLRLVRDADYRARLMDDLQELRAFLHHRRLESGSNTLAYGNCSGELATYDASRVQAMLAAIDAVLEQLTSPELKQVLLTCTSRQYLERLCAKLQRKAGQEQRLLAAAAEAQTKMHHAKHSLIAVQPKISALVERTKAIKQYVEKALAGLLNGRRVNVLGEINTVLYQGAK